MQNKFPLWKNMLLVFLVVVGIIYALPNIYTEEPAIQVSSDREVDPASLENTVKQTLNDNQVPFLKVQSLEQGVEVRFANTDYQLQARDLIKAAVGQDYTVALNLASTTPSWLTAIGATPMKQGLDLRGGVHFLLQVDIDSVLARRYEGMKKNLIQDMREAKIRFSSIREQNQQGILIGFRDTNTYNNALKLLRQQHSDLVLVKRDAQMRILASLSPGELNNVRQNTIDQTMTILRNRVNELGVGEAVVQQQGATRIAVDLPGIQDATRAKQILGGTATLQFHLVDEDNDAEIASQTGTVPMNSKLYTLNEHPILLKRMVVLSGDAITSAVSSFDQQSASPSVQIQLGGGGESLFTKMTRENIGRRMAIVYVETKTREVVKNGKVERESKKEERVISAPVIQSALGNNFQITGMKDAKEASNLALLLRAGALPAAIYTVEERTVGPSLGQENIRRGVISLQVGMGLVLLTMIVYYRFFGMVANVALLLNLVFLVALLSLIDATLTLPGIAGIVLTVGMAVDANVLIYERIREELRHGMTTQAAIHAGYDRAFSTIIDANITTLIVAVILFAIGTGPVRGFAITLSLGLMTSMLSGITYTRALVNWWYGGRLVKKLSIGI